MSDLVSVLWLSVCPSCLVNACPWLYCLISEVFISFVSCLSWSEPDGRFLMCAFRFRNQVFRVCCVYAPTSNPQRNQFLDDVSVSIDPSVPTVLDGDFNTVFHRSLDRRGSDPFDLSRESSCALNRLINACSSIDIWRYLHPMSSSYTWTRSNGSLSSRIDFILVPHVWVPSVSSCDIVACPFSDHALLLCLFVFLKFLLMIP